MIQQTQVTVFGGGGHLGRHAVRALAKAGYRIVVAVRRPHLVPELKVMGDVGQIALVQANLRDAASVARAVQGSGAVVNLVGLLYAHGRQSFAAIQSDGAETLAKAAKAAGVTAFVQVSAIGADPNSPALYGRTKAEGEARVRAVYPGAVVLRPSVVFGPEDDFFNRFAAMAAVAPVLPLVGGATRLQPVYVGDVAKAVLASLEGALAGGEVLGQTYELGGPRIYTMRELLQLVIQETGRKRPLLPVPAPLASLIASLGDVQAAVTAFPPILTTDQLKLLGRDNVATGPGLAALGISPTSLEAVLPTYLWRFREGGQFADVGHGAPG